MHRQPQTPAPKESPMPETPLRWWQWLLLAAAIAAVFTVIAWTAPTC